MDFALSIRRSVEGLGDHFVMPPSALTRFFLQNLPARPGAVAVDLGCGCGALAIALVQRGAARCWAIDLNPDAVYATYLSARSSGIGRKVIAAIGNINDVQYVIPEPIDLVVSNPPQLPAARMASSATSRRDMAYDAGPDGRKYVDMIIGKAAAILGRSLHPAPELHLVTTSVVGFQATLTLLKSEGFETEVVAEKEEAFRPVYLERLPAMRRGTYTIRDGVYFETIYVLASRLKRRGRRR